MLSKLFKDGQRVDGRGLLEYREVVVTFPRCEVTRGGSCLASLGDTTVLATVSWEIKEPKTSHPSRGLINLKMDTSLLKSTSNKLRSSTDETMKLEPIIKDLFRDSIDLDSLCICAGEKVFCINIDLKAQTDDGNLLDAIVLASTISLTTFRRPDVTIDEYGNFVVHEDMIEKDPVPLKLKQLPIFVTLGVGLENNLIILDLNKDEEETLDSKLVIGMTPTGEVCCMYPLGARLWIYDDFLDRCLELVMKKVVALQCLVSQVVEAIQSTKDTIVISSYSYLGSHPIFDKNDAVIEVEEVIPVHEAPEMLDDDDMEIESDFEDHIATDKGDDWNRIDQLMRHTENM